MAAQQFADFAELSLRLKDVRFTLICCPSTQFLNQESPTAEDVQGFVVRKLGPSGGSFIVTEKVQSRMPCKRPFNFACIRTNHPKSSFEEALTVQPTKPIKEDQDETHTPRIIKAHFFVMPPKVDVNGSKTHPLFYYLKRHSCLYEERSNSAMPIPWNYGKFLVGLDGQVVGYKGPKSSPLDFEPEIRALLGQQ